MNIKETFLKLTSRTYPHGTERDIFPLINTYLKEDEFGNLFTKIGESDVLFTSHLDTATSANTFVNHVIENNFIKTDGTSILGADDKAGVTIMLYMIENNIPGLYYFFIGEEVGCIGSRKVSAISDKIKEFESIKKVISFDRRGTKSIITFQSGSRCCSDKFGNALSDALNKADSTFEFKNDTTGLLTDSIQFRETYPECTNISVGYQNEHTFSEVQDIDFLEKLANACLKVDWNNLPVDRDPSVVEYSNYGYNWGRYYKDWDNDDFDYPSYKTYDEKPKVDPNQKIYFYDKKYSHFSSLTIQKNNSKVVDINLSFDRIRHESVIITDLLRSLELGFDSIIWNGMTLKVFYKNGEISEANRNELLEYLPEIDYKSGVTLGASPYSKSIEPLSPQDYLDESFYD